MMATEQTHKKAKENLSDRQSKWRTASCACVRVCFPMPMISQNGNGCGMVWVCVDVRE